MQHIQTIELASTEANITFSSIPDTFTDLQVVLSLRSNRTPSSDGSHIGVRFNGTTTGYSLRHLRGNGSAASSLADASPSSITGYSFANSAADTANTFSNTILYVPNYRAATAKSLMLDSVYENNATTAFQHILAGLWNNTDPITSITFIEVFGNSWVQYSSASLYGITAGSDGIVSVS